MHIGVLLRPMVLGCALVLLACGDPPAPDGAQGEIADASCGFVQRVAHADPAQLIAEFVERDARGEFAQVSDWFSGAVTCPGQEHMPENVPMVKGHMQRLVLARPDSMVVEVTWSRISYQAFTGLAPGVDIDTLIAVRTTFGWRIVSPALYPKVPVPPAPQLP